MKKLCVLLIILGTRVSYGQANFWQGSINSCSRISASCKALRDRGCKNSQGNIKLPVSGIVQKLNCNMTYADHSGKVGGYTLIANKAAADGVYFPVQPRALGFYDFAKTVNGTFSYSLANFEGKPGTVLLSSSGYTVELRWDGNSVTPNFTRKFASGLASKMYSLTCAGGGSSNSCANGTSVAINDGLFVNGTALAESQVNKSSAGTIYEGGCAIYSRNSADTFGYGNSFTNFGIVGAGWGRGAQYWCPYGIGGYGDGGTVNNPLSPSSYVGYPWGAMNYTSGSGTSVEVWFRED